MTDDRMTDDPLTIECRPQAAAAVPPPPPHGRRGGEQPKT
jgi:hypothetical protein